MTYRRFTGCLHPFERPLALLEPGTTGPGPRAGPGPRRAIEPRV